MIFPKGFKKLMIPINIGDKMINTVLLEKIKKVNLYSYLFILSFSIAFLSGFLTMLSQ